MKRKVIGVLLSVAMAATLLTGCGGSKDSKNADNAQAAEESPAAEDDQEEGTAEGEEEEPAGTVGIAKEDLKVGFVHIGDPSDMGYTYNHDQGTKKMQEAIGLTDDQIVNKFNTPEDAGCDTALRELVDAGCNIIFGTSFGFEDYMLEVAKEYPDVQFCHSTGYQAASSGLANMHNYFTSIYQARYLSGIAAGKKTQSNKLGYVAAFPYAEVISGFTSFYLGAKSVNPNVTMEIQYTNSWNDPKKEAEVAQALIDNGCDVISQHSDSTAPATTAEKNGVWQAGYNADTISAAPKASLVSACIDWSIYLTEAVQAVIDGDEIPVDWCQGLSEDGGQDAVFLSPLNTDIIAEGTQEAIDEATEKIRAGELDVFAGPLKGVSPEGEEYEVKEGEHFPEQEEASAPSWSYIVDGCTVVE